MCGCVWACVGCVVCLKMPAEHPCSSTMCTLPAAGGSRRRSNVGWDLALSLPMKSWFVRPQCCAPMGCGTCSGRPSLPHSPPLPQILLRVGTGRSLASQQTWPYERSTSRHACTWPCERSTWQYGVSAEAKRISYQDAAVQRIVVLHRITGKATHKSCVTFIVLA